MKIFLSVIFTLVFAFAVFAQTQAEVVVPFTFLRKAPNTNGEKLQTLQKGDKLKVEKVEDKNGWLFVLAPDGKTKGWVSVNAVSQTQVSSDTGSVPEANSTLPVKPTPSPRPTPNTSPTALPVSGIVSAPKPVPAQTVEPTPKPTVGSGSSSTPKPTPPPEATPIIDDEILRVDTEEVSLNVRVVDEKNRFVSNLAETDFKVYEDNVLQPITALTKTEVPTINGLVIDNSRSLRSQLGQIIEAGKIIIGTNRQNDESTIIRFINKDKIEVVQDFTRNKNSLNNALDNLFVEGGQTAIVDAIYMAAKKIDRYQNSGKKEDVRLRSLILVSDGEDRGSTYSEQALFDLLRQANVQIYAIGFVNNLSAAPVDGGTSPREKARSFLTRLAQETGGKVYFPASINELSGIATEISGELRTQYTISYMPTNETRDGSFRAIKVAVNEGSNREKRIAITRTGRTVAPK